MSPLAEQAGAAAAMPAVPAEALNDGEEVILALKPSGWFVLFASWPVLAAAVMIGVASYPLHLAGPYQLVPLACTGAACLRVVIACGQWAGMLYVLTNRRVIRLRGTTRPEVRSCILREIAGADVSTGTAEGLLGLGSIVFELHGGARPDICWVNVPDPRGVQETINQAVRRAR